MKIAKTVLGAALIAVCGAAHATTFQFDTDPFAGFNVLNVPGRQIVGGESFVNFSIATDLFSMDSTVFGVGNSVQFVNAPASLLPGSGVNIVVLENFDDDNNPLTPFGASNAANLIASKVHTPEPGFFVYFNESLDLPRLVYSSDLSSTDSDLRILARILNLNGQLGRDAMPNFTAANFALTTSAAAAPEPSTVLMILLGIGSGCLAQRRRRGSTLV